MTDNLPPPATSTPPSTTGSASFGASAPTVPAAPPKSQYSGGRPALLKELPLTRVPEPDPKFKLIKDEDLEKLFHEKKIGTAVAHEIREDLKFLETELMRLFRDRDYLAKLHQNRYRLYQILYIWLAALAGMLGAVQALSLDRNPSFVPIAAFLETVVALFVAFLASVGGREPPMPLWLNNRRAAEQLRREFFRYVTHLPPYDELDSVRRRITLSQRAADISRGVYPQPTTPPSNGNA